MQKELTKQQACADDNARRYRNKAREALQAKTTRDLLCAEKAHIYNVACANASCVPQQKAHAVTKALQKACTAPNEHYMKVRALCEMAAKRC